MKPLFSDTPPEVEHVLGIMKTQGGQLDMPYLTRTAALLNVEDLFQQACRDAGLAGEDD